MDYKVTDNSTEARFEYIDGTGLAVLTYHYFKGDLVLIHTEVPESMQGKGISGVLASAALNYAAEQNLKIIVHCPIVSKYVSRHPEFNHLIKADHSQNKTRDLPAK